MIKRKKSASINRSLIKPIRSMSATMKELAQGNFNVRLSKKVSSPFAKLMNFTKASIQSQKS